MQITLHNICPPIIIIYFFFVIILKKRVGHWVADPPLAYFTIDTDTHPLSYGQSHLWSHRLCSNIRHKPKSMHLWSPTFHDRIFWTNHGIVNCLKFTMFIKLTSFLWFSVSLTQTIVLFLSFKEIFCKIFLMNYWLNNSSVCSAALGYAWFSY